VELLIGPLPGTPPPVSRAVRVPGCSSYGFEARDPLTKLAGAGWAGWETDLAVAYPYHQEQGPQVYQLRPLTILDYTQQTPLLVDAQQLLHQLAGPAPTCSSSMSSLRDRLAAKLAISHSPHVSAEAVRQSHEEEGGECFSGQSGPAAQARRERDILRASQLRR
jgi:hypothetical protein